MKDSFCKHLLHEIRPHVCDACELPLSLPPTKRLSSRLHQGSCPKNIIPGALTPGTIIPQQLNSAWWHLISVGPQFETCFMSPFWHLQLWGGPLDLWKLCVALALSYTKPTSTGDFECFLSHCKWAHFLTQNTFLRHTVTTFCDSCAQLSLYLTFWHW